MIEFLIKSTLSSGAFYLVYLFYLRPLKTFSLNRYFLLGALLTALIVPLFDIPLELSEGVKGTHEKLKTISAVVSQTDDQLLAINAKQSIWPAILMMSYFILSTILIVRFTNNIWIIISTVNKSKVQRIKGYYLALTNESLVPHSFFNFIILNKQAFENGQISQAIIVHEQAHVDQGHSFDILILEICKVFFWINPFIWMLGKSIRLNHEFIADQQALQQLDFKDYQQTILESVTSNYTTALACSFNYPFTKQRFIMMTKHFSRIRAIVNYTFSTLAFVLITGALTFSQVKDFEYKLFVDGMHQDYAKKGPKHAKFGALTIKTNR